MLGRKNIENGGELLREYAKKLLGKLEIKINGKNRGGIDSSDDVRCRNEIEKIFK